MSSLAKNCKLQSKRELGETPIPRYTGEMLHIDIFSTERKQFLTCVGKLSKFAVVQPVQSRIIVDIIGLQLLNLFPKVKTIYCDNEAALNSKPFSSY